MTKTIAIPIANNALSAHFGHCDRFDVFTVIDHMIMHHQQVSLPTDENQSYPEYLKELGCDVLIAGGMGNRVRELCEQYQLEVYLGIPEIPLDKLVMMYVNNELSTGAKPCDHNCTD